MAANKIYLEIEVDDKGTTKKVAVDAAKLRKAMDSASEGAERYSRSQRTAYRNAQGVAQTTANGTKAFAKQAQGIGGILVPAYATLAANVFAVTAAFNSLNRAAQVQQLENSLQRTGAIAGKNLLGLAKNLKEVTGSAIGTTQALEAVAVGTAQNFSDTQLTELTRIAKGASIALGRDLSDSLDRLIRGTAKLEPEILDELGIIVRLDDAATTYAAALGKTAGQLTQFEKQQAFANAVAEQGAKKFGEIADSTDPTPYQKLAATFDNVSTSILGGISKALGPLVELLSESPLALTGVLAAFATTIGKQLTPALLDLAKDSEYAFELAKKAAEDTLNEIKGQYTSLKESFLEEVDILPGKGGKKLIEDLQNGTEAAKSFEDALDSIKKSKIQRNSGIEKIKQQLEEAKKSTSTLTNEEVSALEEKLKLRTEELAKVEALEERIKSLRDLEKKGGGEELSGKLKTKKEKTEAFSTIAGIESEALGSMVSAGVIDQFKIANDAAKRMFDQLDNVNGILPSLSVRFRAAATSAKLFGIAILNAIPIIGQILAVLSVAYEVLDSFINFPWEKGRLEEAADDIVENLENVSEAAIEMKLAVLQAGTESQKTFIKLRGGVGIINQLANSISQLAKAQTQIKSEDVKKLVEGIRELENPSLITRIGQFTESLGKSLLGISDFSPAKKGIKELADAYEELKILLNTPITLDKEASTTVLFQGKQQALLAGFSEDSKVVQVYNRALLELANSVDKKGNIPVEFFAAINKELLDLSVNQSRFTTAFSEIGQAVSNFNTEINKFAGKQQTPFSGIASSAEALVGILKNINEGLSEALKKGPINLLEEVEQQGGKGAKDFIEGLRDTDTYKDALNSARRDRVSETEADAIALTATLESVSRSISAANTLYREQSTIIDSIKEKISERSKLSSNNSKILEFQIAAEKELLNAEIKRARTTIEALDGKEKTKEIIELINKLTKDITNSEQKLINLSNDIVRVKTTQLAQEKLLTDARNKSLEAAQKELDLQQRILAVQDKKSLRESQNRPFFDFIDQGKTSLNQQLEAQQRKLLQLQSENQNKINEGKKAIIRAEYALLRAQLNAQATMIENDAQRIEDFAAARELRNISSGLRGPENTAISNINLESQATIAETIETIEALKQAKTELSDIDQITNVLEDSFTNGLTSAINGVIQGTMNMKDAFKSMAVGVLQALSQVLAKLIAIKLIESAIGFFESGATGLESLASAGAGADSGWTVLGQMSTPKRRYGGVTEPVPGYAMGGIARGRDAGYPAILHGTEAVVPLPNNRSIPVDLKGAGQMNNVTVNVAVDSNGNAQQNSQANAKQGADLGNAIAAAVQKELQNQKRSGGILNPYGVA